MFFALLGRRGSVSEAIKEVVVLVNFCGAGFHATQRTLRHVHVRLHIYAGLHGCDCPVRTWMDLIVEAWRQGRIDVLCLCEQRPSSSIDSEVCSHFIKRILGSREAAAS